MNLHYRVEKAFDDLENAIACAELHNSTSAADAKRYAQLLDDVIGLRDGVKKESAPAVGATEAAKEKYHKFSVTENGKNVKPNLFSVTTPARNDTDLEIRIHFPSEENRRGVAECLFEMTSVIARLFEFSKALAQKENNPIGDECK